MGVSGEIRKFKMFWMSFNLSQTRRDHIMTKEGEEVA